MTTLDLELNDWGSVFLMKTSRHETWTDLTPSSFEEFVQVNAFAVVHFWATWNGHDVEMKRFLETEAGEKIRGLVAFGRFDLDPPGHIELCNDHKLRNIPFLEFYRHGVLVGFVTGLQKVLILKRLAELVAVPI